MLKRIFMIGVLFFASNAIAAQNIAQNPYKSMQVTADKIFTSINNNHAQLKNNPELLRKIVKQDLLPYVQVNYAGALILGNYYKTATTEQRKAYFVAFENYLVQAFAQALSMYNGQQYQIESAKDVSNKNLISIRVLLLHADKNQQPLRIDFQWRKNSVSGEWKAYDLIAEGVSMITSKQSEWSTILRTEGIDALTKQLQNLANEKIKLDSENSL